MLALAKVIYFSNDSEQRIESFSFFGHIKIEKMKLRFDSRRDRNNDMIVDVI